MVMILSLLLCMGVTLRDGCWAAGGVKKFHQIYAAAADAVHARDYPGAMNLLEEAISLAPNSIDALQLYGALAVKLGDYDRGLPYIQKAIELDNWTNPEVVSNYIQALRLDGRMEKALEVARKAVALFPTSISLLVNSAYAFMDAKDIHSTDLFEAVLKLRPDNLDYWQGLIEVYLRLGLIKEAEAVAKRGAKLHPQSGRMMYYLGHCAQLQDRITEALELYQISTQLDPSDREAWAGIGGAFQELGQLEDAADVYSRIAEISMNDHAFLNNFGALLTNMDHRHEEGEMYLRKAIEMKPDSLKTLANLGTYYHDEGSIPLAREMFHRASAAYQSRHTEHNNLFGLRAALILPQVPSSYENMVDERNRLERELREFIAHSPPTGPKDVLDGVFDRTVFYIQYHGFNDRLIQELISEVYRKNILDFEVFNELANPSLSAIAMNYQKKSKKIRVGFISKFFGVFEPHALLLDGVMQYLPRSKFEVYAFPVTRSDGKPLAPGISEGADVIVPLSLNHAEATIAVSAAGLDILVFADTQSEPMTHFMCHHRIAPVQIAFWGNPITSASRQIDFFVSSADMEHPFRTHFRADDEPYSEQVVLLDGQGIWYYHPDAPQLQIPAGNKYSHLKAVPVSRTDFGLGEEWFLFFCPQSVFKMHPLFDYVFADILSRAPHAHVVVTGGRRATWTDQYISRMRAAMEPKIFERIHVIKRISSEKFLNLLRIANVLLHPFPFDGSRTSADGLGVGIPVLTLPTEYLRGRMCHAFYRTMDLPELVAQNRSDYVNIAVKLAYDSQFYQSVKQRLVDNSYLIWEDIEVPFMWSNFLTHLGGARPVNWDQFLLESGRNIAKENDLKRKREENRQNFRRRWGEETWLLRSDGVAPMISTPNKYEPPVIFADWNFGQLPEAVNMSGVIARHQMDSTASSMKKADIITSPGQEDSTTYGNLYRSDILQLLSAEGALAASNSALKLYDLCSNDSFYLLELGILHLNAGDFTGALRYCRDSLTINPHCLTCQICVGISAVANDKEDSAVNALAKAWSILKSGPLDGPSTELLLPTVDLIEYSLLEALLHFQKYDDCLDLVETFLDLPPLNAGGAVAIVFSLVNWSDDSVEKYFQKHELLRSSGAQTSHSLFGTIRRLQQNHLDILPSACRCLDHATLSDDITAVKDARAKLKAIIDEADFDFLERSRHKDDHQQSKVVLLTKYFPPEEGSNDSGNSCYVAFRDELNRALLINLNNPIIDKVALVTNREHDFTSIFGAALASKIVYVSSNSIERVIYSTIFKFVNDNFDAGSIIIFAESGIYFDESLFRISSTFSRLRTPKTVFALSVWNEISVEGDNSLFPDFRLNLPLQLDYHNAWVFTAPISNYVVNQSVIKVKEVHSRGNMHSILYGAGYSIDNPALTIRAISINAACDRNQHRDSKTDVMVTDLKDIKLILYADTSFQNDMVE